MMAIIYGPSPSDSETDGALPSGWNKNSMSVLVIDDGDVIAPYSGTKCILCTGAWGNTELPSAQTSEPVYVALQAKGATDQIHFASQVSTGTAVGNDFLVYLALYDGYIKYYHTGAYHNITAYTYGTWAYLKIVHDCTANTFDIWKWSGTEWTAIGTDLAFRNSQASFINFVVATTGGDDCGVDVLQVGEGASTIYVRFDGETFANTSDIQVRYDGEVFA